MIAVAGIVTFAFLGAIQALYGPLLPGLRHVFAVDTGTVGLVFAAHGLGALVGILVPSFVQAPALAERWLSIATGLLLTGAAAMSIAPTWPALLAAVFVLAMGFGIHVVRLNGLFVAGFGTRGMAMSLLINAAFSVGAILGPVAVAASGEPSRRLFGGVAALALALLPLAVGADRRGRAVASSALSHGPNSASHAATRLRSRALLGAFVALMCLTSGTENSIGGWTATLALADGHTFSSAAQLTALFFGCIFAGRLAAAGFGHRVKPAFLVLAGIGCLAAALSIASVTHNAAIALALSGFAIAPIFSATLVWLGASLPTSARANAFVIAGALLGAASFPPLVGRVIGQFGVSAAPPAILCIALAALAVAVAIYVARRP
ncbi:MAG TPA: MFS transporter [Burkholderiales bacterium]|nr:MFS transporter [Burkholderiales bacterium]